MTYMISFLNVHVTISRLYLIEFTEYGDIRKSWKAFKNSLKIACECDFTSFPSQVRMVTGAASTPSLTVMPLASTGYFTSFRSFLKIPHLDSLVLPDWTLEFCVYLGILGLVFSSRLLSKVK